MPSPYIVCSSPRAGTNYLKHLITSQGMGFPSEIDLTRRPIETLEELDLHTLRGNVDATVWSRTLWYYLKNDFIDICKKLKTLPEGITTDKEILDASFPGLKYIYLCRKDRLAQGLSMARAQLTDAWIIPSDFHDKSIHDKLLAQHRNVVYDRDRIIAALAELDGYYYHWKKWFKDEEIEHLKIYYEDALENPADTIKSIAEFLEFDIEFSQEKLDAWSNRFPVRQSDEITQEWRKLYERGDTEPKRTAIPVITSKAQSTMNVSFIVPESWMNLDELNEKPQIGQGGGGVKNKFLNVRKALEDAHFTNTFDDPEMRLVIIVEPMVFHKNNGTSIEESLTKLKEKPGVKLLWCEEQAVFRWNGTLREQVFDVFDAILASNLYQAQLISVIAPNKPILVLYTPIDEKVYYPGEKQKQVIYAGKLGLQKNTETLIELYKALSEKGIHTICIGNAALWGQYVYEYDKDLESEMSRVAGEFISTASPLETATYMNASSTGVNMSIYDVGPLHFLESAIAGCYFFAWNYHPCFDEYEHVHRFSNIDEGVDKIVESVGITQIVSPLYEEVYNKHSYQAFRTRLKTVIGEVI